MSHPDASTSRRISVRELVDVLSTLLVAVAAVIMLGFYVSDRRPGTSEGQYAEDWQAWDVAGVHVGPADAGMVISVFMDFTCPFCRNLVPALDSIMAEYPREVAMRFHHFPLGREGSFESAVAAECASLQGRFSEMYRVIYALSDSIGKRSWEAFGRDAGVPDVQEFEECTARPPESFPRITAARELADRLEVRGTPTIWVNGHRFNQGRSVAAFRQKAADLGLGS